MENAISLADLAIRAAATFQSKFGRAPTVVVAAPGRVNLIGEHTDYNDGFVLPMRRAIWSTTHTLPRCASNTGSANSSPGIGTSCALPIFGFRIRSPRACLPGSHQAG